MRSSHLAVTAEEHTDYTLHASMIEVFCTTLSSGVTHIKVVPSPSLGTRNPNCIYSNFLCADRSPWTSIVRFSL